MGWLQTKKKRGRRRICVIGLGHFGMSLARALAPRCEVLAIDADLARVDAIASSVHRAVCLDARDQEALASLIDDTFDEVVIGIGSDLEASILCTLHLTRLGVPRIRAKADTADHAAILESLGAAQIVFPERDSAERLAMGMLDTNLLDVIPLADDYQVCDARAPTHFWGRTLTDLQVRRRHGVFVIALRRGPDQVFDFLPDPDRPIAEGDVLVLIGTEVRIRSLIEA